MTNEIDTSGGKEAMERILNKALEEIELGDKIAEEKPIVNAGLAAIEETKIAMQKKSEERALHLEMSKKMPLTVCIVYNDNDEQYLQECVSMLPADIELILVKNIQGDRTGKKLIQEGIDGGVYLRHYELYQTELNISEARNFVMMMAQRKYILFLDPDERLFWNWNQFKEIFALKDPTVGGYFITVVSCLPNLDGSKTVRRRTAQPQLRLIRNPLGLASNIPIRWQFRVHEQISLGLHNAGYGFFDTSIVINHIGYFEESKEVMIAKLKKYTTCLIKDLAVEPEQPYLLAKLTDHLNQLMRWGEIHDIKELTS